MKRFVSFMTFAAGLLAVSPVASAQDCSDWTNWDLRGTYAISGSGWIDLSKLAPGLPAGLTPISWVGLENMDGNGVATGWVSANAGGVPLTFDFVNKTYAVQADCSVQVTFSMKVKELGGAVIGPVSRILVIAGQKDQQDLELEMILVGGGPGTSVDLGVARRTWIPRYYPPPSRSRIER